MTVQTTVQTTVRDDGPATTVRLRLDLAYEGTAFSGWAAQPGLRTVEGELATAVTTVLRAPAPVSLTVAGRTDAGVHARGQVVHVDVEPAALAALPGRSNRTPEEALLRRLGGLLAPDVVVHRVARAPEGFDARFSAQERRYLYRLADADALRDPLRRHDTVWWPRPLDAERMDEAARSLVGLRDFAAFCKRRDGATTVRTLLEYRWVRLGDGVLAATVRADAFCHSMVRSLVGAAVAVGEGRRTTSWPAELQQRTQRAADVRVMPAHGLSLEAVTYPPDSELASRAETARARREPPPVGDATA
ncbi:tRNA pseudouridine(38-40) synthase TruA [Intrasporangium calvum]|uniref:tRNA pseudouridine(38-40) synthase TruA n=1 Tax=Intrasporangium calvum TaxID=53358 RepID=UPI000DF61FEA|nr:tRNA pseudouridine(38-40) synthase TruA [Intrasporangium calvum]AXG14149.1 tRNA pseudouridine(38-40) synthase TruA [Intrasporangium calvum]